MTSHRPGVAVVARLWINSPSSPCPASPRVVDSRNMREPSHEALLANGDMMHFVLGAQSVTKNGREGRLPIEFGDVSLHRR